MSKPVRMTAFAVASVVAMVLTACRSGAPTRLYTLAPSTPDAAATSSTSRYSGPPLQVRAVHVPADLDRIEFIRESSPGQWSVLEQDHWAAPLSRLIRQTLTEDLAARLPAGVMYFPNAPACAEAVGIAVDILSLRIADGQALLQVGWSVDPPLPSARAPHAAQLQLSTPSGNANALDISRALSRLLGQLADHLAADLSLQ